MPLLFNVVRALLNESGATRKDDAADNRYTMEIKAISPCRVP